jgi:uncharacterized lipoprotein YddW (UPF0748 family)
MRSSFGKLRRCFGGAIPLLLALSLAHSARHARAEAAGNKNGRPGPDEVRGIWMWSSAVREEGAETVAKELSRSHINKVFFLVKGYSGKVCYPSRLAPASESGTDSLKEILEACHKRGIEVHAWYVFNADNDWGRKHPEDAMCHAGKPTAWDQGPYSKKDDPQKLPICPLSGEYRGYLKKLIQEVLDRYDVDGIHLDYIRYGHLCYCFCPRHQAFAAGKGIQVENVRKAIFNTLYSPTKKSDYYFKQYRAGDRDLVAWVGMREEEIHVAVKEIREVVKAKKPSLALSAAFMPEGGELDDTYALCHYAQNYATAGAELDYILPMTYGKSSQWVAQIARNAEKKSHRPVYSGLWASEQPPHPKVEDGQKQVANANGASSPAQRLREEVQALRTQGTKGFVLFRYGSLSDRMWRDLP